MTTDLVKNIKECMTSNLPKFVISLLIMGIITTAMMAFTMVPMASAIMSSTMDATSIIMIIVTALVFSSLQYVLQYGFFVLVFLLYAHRYAVLGHLFSGFRDFKRAFLLGLIFTLIYIIILSIVGVVFTMLISTETIIIEFEMLIAILGIVSAIVLSILYINFAFAWFLLYENSRITVHAAIKQSLEITKGKKIAFIILCIKSAQYYLPVGIASFIIIQLPTFVPSFDATSTIFVSISSVLSFAYSVCLYISIMRFSIAFAAWYVAYFDSPPAIEEIDQRIISLPDYHDLQKKSDAETESE